MFSPLRTVLVKKSSVINGAKRRMNALKIFKSSINPGPIFLIKGRKAQKIF